MIRIFDKFGELLETCEYAGSFKSYLIDLGYNPVCQLPFSMELNGAKADDIDFDLSEMDELNITIEPAGSPTTWMIVITLLSAAYSYYVASNIPRGYENTTESGKSIYSPSAGANSIVKNGIIREVGGNITFFPDLICQPRRKYIDNEEYLYLAMGVGNGHFNLSESNIYIAETPIRSYTSDIVSNIFEPGQSNAGVVSMENWYTSKEVQDLKLTTVGKPVYGNWTVDFSGATMTSYLDGVPTQFPFDVGELVDFFSLSSANSGFYEVISIGGTNNSVATVVELDYESEESGKLEVISQITYARDESGKLVRYPTNGLGSPIFTTEAGIAADWSSMTGGVNWEGPFQVIPVNETARYAEVDIRFPGGLGQLDASNNVINRGVEIYVEWKAVGASAWNRVLGTNYTDATLDEKALTIEIDFGSYIRPEFRIRRVTKDSNLASIFDIVQVVRIKCQLESPASYPITTIGMRLKGTNALASTAENRINIRSATRKLPTLAELESGVWDLSDSATKIDGSWKLLNPEFAFNRQCTDLGDQAHTTTSKTNITFNESGNEAIVYAGGNVFFVYSVPTPFAFNGGQVYHGFFAGGSVDYEYLQSAQHSTGNYWLTIERSKPPGSIYTATIRNITIPTDGEFTLNSSSSYGTGVAGPSINSFDMAHDGLSAFITESGIIKNYALSVAWDLSTISVSPSSQYDFFAEDARSVSHICLGNYASNQPTKLYLLSSNTIYEYDFGVAGNLSTLTDTGRSYSISGISHIQFYADRFITSNNVSNIGYYSQYDIESVADLRATRSIARFAGWSIRQMIGSKAATQIDWSALSSLDALWNSRGDYFDGEFADETTLWDALKVIVAPGYAEPTIKEGKFLPVRTSNSFSASSVYTPDIMTGSGVRIDSTHFESEEPDGVDVEYFSLQSNGIEIVECRLAGDLGINPKRIQALGITDSTKAWRFGMRERARLKQKPATITFSTEMDALNDEYGSNILVSSPIFSSQCGSLMDYSAPTVTLDFEPEFGAGTHYAVFRNREGGHSGLYTVTAGAGANQITLVSPATLDFVPVTDGSMDDTFMVFGTAEQIGKQAIIRSIMPSDDNYVDVTAEEYVPAVYAYDDSAPS